MSWDFSNSGGYVAWSGNMVTNFMWDFVNGTIAFTFTNGLTVPITLSFSGSVSGGNAGPTTDYAINPWINDPVAGGVAAANAKFLLANIADGTSNTILMGHAYLARSDYQLTTPSSTLTSIFSGGTLGTGRSSLGNTAATWLQDGTAATSNQWGSPLASGGLMAMADGSVHLFPYATSLQTFLKPNDGNPIPVP